MFILVGWQLEWRDGEVWEVGGGRVSTSLFYGEYIWAYLPDRREEVENFWTRERWILEKGEQWMGGPYYLRGRYMFSFRDPGLKIEISAKAAENWRRLWMLGKRPIYRGWFENTVRDARTDTVLFDAKYLWVCDAGFAIQNGGHLYFTDGVRKDLPIDKIGRDDTVEFLRVSETEYSLRVGIRATACRYYLLDAAKWTCIKI